MIPILTSILIGFASCLLGFLIGHASGEMMANGKCAHLHADIIARMREKFALTGHVDSLTEAFDAVKESVIAELHDER